MELDKPDMKILKSLTKKEAKEISKRASEKAADLRRSREYPQKLLDTINREVKLQAEVHMLLDAVDSDLPDGKMIETNELLAAKADELAAVLEDKKKYQKLIQGK